MGLSEITFSYPHSQGAGVSTSAGSESTDDEISHWLYCMLCVPMQFQISGVE